MRAQNLWSSHAHTASALWLSHLPSQTLRIGNCKIERLGKAHLRRWEVLWLWQTAGANCWGAGTWLRKWLRLGGGIFWWVVILWIRLAWNLLCI